MESLVSRRIVSAGIISSASMSSKMHEHDSLCYFCNFEWLYDSGCDLYDVRVCPGIR